MSLRWLQLGTLTFILAPTASALAQAPKTDREGGLLPPVVQVVAKEPIDEEEITVELIKVMPKTRDQMKSKTDLGDNFKTIKIKRDKTDEPIAMNSDEPVKMADKPAEKITKVRQDEPLNFVPTEKQKALPISDVAKTKAAEPRVIMEERAPRIIKVPVREPAMNDWKMPEVSWPSMPTPHCAADNSSDCPMPTLADSNVGWIESALIGTQARVRYDARWRNPTPDRAEFITGRNKQYFDGFDISGRGFAVPESNLDIFEANFYLEWAYSPRISGFIELPLRSVHPAENPNAFGIGDFNVGVKVAYFMMPEQVQTFQLRLVMPSGNAGLGLGTGHAVIEPSLLLWQKLSERWTLEGQLRNWIPVGGTNHAGYTLIYGLGLSFDAYHTDTMCIKPVAELLGWSTFRGMQSDFIDSLPTFQSTGDARGTVLESAFGFRGTVMSNCDWYLGYSYSLLDTTWFKHNLRAELRWRF